MIDMSGSEGREPIEDYKVINQELAAYEQRLEDRPQIVVANKMDLPESQDNLILFKERNWRRCASYSSFNNNA